MPVAQTLKQEARALGRFILGRDPAPEFIERYAVACGHVFREPVSPGEAAILALAVRRPMLLPCLDAAAALVRPKSLLHRKALLMAAILEASPVYADEFLPRRASVLGLLVIGVWTGLASALQIAIGLPLIAVVGRER